MSYSIRPDKFISHLTGKEYKFVRFGKEAPASKARALNELREDHQKIEQAAEKRHGRPLSLRELRDGPTEPDYRSVRQQAADGEILHTAQPKTDPNKNPYSARIVELEQKLRYTTHAPDRARIQRRIDVLHESSNRFDIELSERRAHQALLESLPVQKAIAECQSELERLAMNEHTPAAFIAAAKMRLAALQESGDLQQYSDAKQQADDLFNDYIAARDAALNDEIERLKTEAGLGEATNSTDSFVPHAGNDGFIATAT